MNGLEKAIAGAIIFKNPGILARAAHASLMQKSSMIEQLEQLLKIESIEYFEKSILLRMCKGRNTN